MHVGYARVSTEDQHAENQVEKLEQAGCKKIYKETASGGRWDRPKLQDCLKHLRDGDVLVVWKLDRLSRSRVADPREGGPRRSHVQIPDGDAAGYNGCLRQAHDADARRVQ
jgi:hypothetical protein